MEEISALSYIPEVFFDTVDENNVTSVNDFCVTQSCASQGTEKSMKNANLQTDFLLLSNLIR